MIDITAGSSLSDKYVATSVLFQPSRGARIIHKRTVDPWLSAERCPVPSAGQVGD